MTFSLQTFINEKVNWPKPIRIIYVAGLDLFDRCHGMRALRSPQMGGVAVIHRSGSNNSLIKSTKEQPDPKVFYVSSNDDDLDVSSSQSEDISSTLIRKRLKHL